MRSAKPKKSHQPQPHKNNVVPEQLPEDVKCQALGLRKRKKEREESPEPEQAVSQTHKTPKNHRLSEPKRLQSSLNEFKRQYESFIKNKSAQMPSSLSLNALFELLTKVYQQKGIVSVLSKGNWNRLVDSLKVRNRQLQSYSNDQIFEIYLKDLIQYEFYLNGDALEVKKGIDIAKTLEIPLILKGDDLNSMLKHNPKDLKWLDIDILIMQNGFQCAGPTEKEITLQLVQEQCGNQRVDVRIQNPMDYGFNINRLVNSKDQMTINSYREYQKHYKDPNWIKQKYPQKLKGNKIFFAVNFQPKSSDLFDLLQNNVKDTFFGFKESFDLLSYLDEDIPGCSSPQFYLKVKGCWTGGHQQNVAMCAVNVNHGPDASEWYSIPHEEVQKVRYVLKQKFKIDLYKNEGLWFQKINWFIENGFRIKRILQKKGDIVVSGPGTLHWVRAFGVALQSAWNIFPKTHKMIAASLHRQKQNCLIQFQKASTIPLKSLLIKYIQHEYQSIEQESLEVILLYVQSWMNNEEQLKKQLQNHIQLGSRDKVLYQLKDLESFCQICHQEVFNYYVQSWSGTGIACLKCLQKQPTVQKKSGQTLYYKYNQFAIHNLLEVARKKNIYSVDITGICSGTHIGKVPKCIKRQKIEQSKRDSPQAETGSEFDCQSLWQTDKQIISKFRKMFKLLQNGETPCLDFAHSVKQQPQQRQKTDTETQTENVYCRCPKCQRSHERRGVYPCKRPKLDDDNEVYVSKSNSKRSTNNHDQRPQKEQTKRKSEYRTRENEYNRNDNRHQKREYRRENGNEKNGNYKSHYNNERSYGDDTRYNGRRNNHEEHGKTNDQEPIQY